MLHPLFSTLVQHPDLALNHASAYAALIHQEAREAAGQLVKRAVAWVLAGVCGGLFVLFAGIALMIGFVQDQFHWILVVVPGVALVMTIVALLKANQTLGAENFPELKAQIDRDVIALRMAD